MILIKLIMASFSTGAEMSWCRTVFFNGCRTVLVPNCLVSGSFTLHLANSETRKRANAPDIVNRQLIPVNPPPFRGSLPRKSLISRMDWVSCAGDINLPHTPFPPPNNKIKYNKILTYILRSIFLEIPHLELDTFTNKLGHGD